METNVDAVEHVMERLRHLREMYYTDFEKREGVDYEAMFEREDEQHRAWIVRHLRHGWTASEIVAYMKHSEEINPDLNEDTALAKMSIVWNNVCERLGVPITSNFR